MQLSGAPPAPLPIADLAIENTCTAIFRNGTVQLAEQVDWPEGQRLVVMPVAAPPSPIKLTGHVIIVGFGLAGRCVADLLDSVGVPYVIIEMPPQQNSWVRIGSGNRPRA